jgi:hypothetical protein
LGPDMEFLGNCAEYGPLAAFFNPMSMHIQMAWKTGPAETGPRPGSANAMHGEDQAFLAASR